MRFWAASVAVFVVWGVWDFLVHQIFLGSEYEATKFLWRPMAEMNMPLMYLTSFVVIVTFLGLYSKFVSSKSVSTGASFGALYGLGIGFSMGFGTFSYQPITMTIAVTWFLSTVVACVIAGVIAGKLITD